MRIVQFLPELNQGGVERGVVELNRELVKRGVDSIVISAGGKQAAQIEADGGQHIQFDVVSKNPLTAPARVYRLRTLLRQLKPDILHARSRVPAWLAYLANRSLHLPFVTTVHGFNSVNAYSRVMTFGDRVICVSNAIKEYIQKHYQVPDEKISVIPRGVDLELFNPERVDQNFIREFVQQYQLAGKYVVTAVGRITQLKDFETFIRGVVAAHDEIPEICGLIVGGVRHDKKGYFETLQKLIKDLKAEQIIHLAGSQQKVAEIYSVSDIVVSSSKKPESFGRTAAEALAMNVPVIATNHGGILDIVRAGETGYLIPTGDTSVLKNYIVQLYQSGFPETRSIVEKEFSLETLVSNTFAVYQSCIDQSFYG